MTAEMPRHLTSAAAALEQILRELHPEYDWIVSVEEGHLSDRNGRPSASIDLDKASALRDHARAISHRDLPSPSDGNDDHTFNEAA
jgi:hypothetical protein